MKCSLKLSKVKVQSYFSISKLTKTSLLTLLFLFSKCQTIIPFRESKLTRLFQSFFLGKGKAAMIVNISQCASVFDETNNVMKFSAVAKQVYCMCKCFKGCFFFMF